MQNKKKVVAITSGDWHIHDWKNHNEGARRIHDSVSIMYKLDKVCQKYGVPLLFTGDLFHIDQNIPSRVIQYVFPAMSDLYETRENVGGQCMGVYGIDGNHDQFDHNTYDNRTPGYFEMMSNTFQCLECVNFKSVELPDFTVHGIPYITRNKDFEKIVNDIELSDGYNILIIHSDLPGAKDTNQRVVGTVRNIPERLSDLFARFDLVISGHIHKAQIMDDNVIMVGAPAQQRKTDIGCKMGYWKIYSDMSYEFVPLKGYPEFKVVDELPDDDKHFYIIEKNKKKKLKDREEENKRDFNVLMSRKKLVSNYMREIGQNDDKKKRRKLKQLLSNA